jgi:hypothetical protein
MPNYRLDGQSVNWDGWAALCRFRGIGAFKYLDRNNFCISDHIVTKQTSTVASLHSYFYFLKPENFSKLLYVQTENHPNQQRKLTRRQK